MPHSVQIQSLQIQSQVRNREGDFKNRLVILEPPTPVDSHNTMASSTSRSVRPSNSIFNVSKKDFVSSVGPDDVTEGEPSSKKSPYPCTLAFYVLPVFSFMHYAFLIPNKIGYDKVSRTFVKVPGSFLRKVCCGVVNISTLIYLSGSLRRFVSFSNGGAMGAMYQVMFVVYIILFICIFNIMWRKMSDIADLLTHVTETTTHFEACGIDIPKSKTVWVMIGLLMTSHVIIALSYALLAYKHFDLSGTVWEVLYKVAKDSAGTAFVTFPPLAGYNIDPKEIEKLPTAVVVTIGVAYDLLEVANHHTWVFTNLVLHLGGLMFRKLFVLFFLKMESNKFLGGNILEDIRDFNSLTMLLDKFNSIFGPLTFFIVIATIVHVSVAVMQMVTMDFSKNVLTFLVLLMTFIPFFGMILAASLVNDLANDVTVLIKHQFNHQNGRCWSRRYGNSLETSQGLSMVYYDLQTNSVGFKGLGFFTVSYSFVGSVLSAIATYAVVAVQFTSSDPKT